MLHLLQEMEAPEEGAFQQFQTDLVGSQQQIRGEVMSMMVAVEV
jgi:hypothetical protein